MSRSRRPNMARQNFVKAERDGWLRTVRDARATVETPEELAVDESFAQIGREVEALADVDEWLRGYREERAKQRDGGLPNYAASDAFFAIFGMVRVEE